MKPHPNPRAAIIASVALVIALIIGAIAFTHLQTPSPSLVVANTATPTPSASASTTPSPTAAANPAFQFSHPGFVFANNNDATSKKFTFSQYDFSTQKLTTSSFPGDNSLDFVSELTSSTGVQLSTSGNVFAYSYSEIGGMGGEAGNANSTNLVLIQTDGTKTFVIKDGATGILSYWKLLPDGLSVVYIQTVDSKSELWKYTLATGKAEKLIDDVAAYYDTAGVEYDATSNSLIFLTFKDQKLDEHVVNLATKVVTEKLLYTATGSSYFSGQSGPYVLSPNKKYAAQTVAHGETDFDLKVVNLATGEVTTLVNSGNLASLSLAGWSPDSSTIAVTKYFFGAGSNVSTTPEIWLVNVSTKEKTVAASGKLDTGYSSIGNWWSPDGKYFVYTDNDSMYLYTLATKKSVKVFTLTTPRTAPPIAWAGF
jgi:hypothetical protein